MGKTKKTAIPDEMPEDRIRQALRDAEDIGITLAPITGHVDRRANKIGIDVLSLGQDPDDVSDEDFYDQAMMVCWLLADKPATVRQALTDGTYEAAKEEWLDGLQLTIAVESILMIALMARWVEYRIETAKIYAAEIEDEDPEDEDPEEDQTAA